MKKYTQVEARQLEVDNEILKEFSVDIIKAINIFRESIRMADDTLVDTVSKIFKQHTQDEE